MEEVKAKVILLGLDGGLLRNVSEKVNKTRPVDVKYYTGLKEFLQACIQDKPDLVGISVTYPHKSVSQFPKIFRMALNLSVFAFGETQDFKTTKALSSTTAETKITGVITAHNLWMKIVNIQKQKADGSSGGSSGSDKMNSEDGKSSNSVFLQGNKDLGMKSQNNNLLSSLMSALENPDAVDSDSGMNLVQSGDSTKFKKEEMSHVNSGDSVSSKMNSMSHVDGDGSSMNSSELGSTAEQISGNKIEESKESLSDNFQEGDRNSESREFTKAKGGSTKKKNSSDLKESFSGENLTEGNDQANETEEEKTRKRDIEFEMGGIKKDPKKPEGKGKDQNNNVSEKNNETNGKDQNLPKVGEKNLNSENNKKQEETFGKIQLSDEKDLKDQAKKKDKEKEEKNNIKKKSVLIAASERGLEGALVAHRSKEIKDFSSRKLYVLTLSLGKYQGYLMIANSQNKRIDEEKLNLFKMKLLESLKEDDVHGEVSQPYELNPDVSGYTEVIKEFTEFSITHKDQVGNSFNVAFVKREVLVPNLEESDKPEMFLVDIKTIPPQTPVNFDAYIYLPRNKKFVRYLKDGRSLSLKQAKRHTEEEDGQGKFYLPKDQKENFFQFFIKNTLNWEFALYKKSDNEAA